MITRVHIRRYKSLADVEVRLRPLSVLFGPNAAGKSNFLDALQLLSAMVTPGQSLNDAFKPPHRGPPLEAFARSEGGVAVILTAESATFDIEVDIAVSEATTRDVARVAGEYGQAAAPEAGDAAPDDAAAAVRHRSLRYRVEVGVAPSRGVLSVRDESLVALDEAGGVVEQFISTQGNRVTRHIEGRRQHPRAILDRLDHTVLASPADPSRFPHVAAAQRELGGWSFLYFDPRGRMRQPSPIREVRQLGPAGEDLSAYLNLLRLEDARQFEAVERAVRLLVPSIDRIGVEQTGRGEAEVYVVEGGVTVPASGLSDGTLRILGMLSLAAAGAGSARLVAIEEPEAGVHPKRMGLVANLLRSVARSDTQVLATTHSPELIDHVPPASLYDVRKRGGVTAVRAVTDTPAYHRHATAVERAAGGAGDADDVPELLSDRLLWSGADD